MSAFRLAVVAGEESGDLLGSDLVSALRRRTEAELTGVGGAHLAAHGLNSLFDPEVIAIAGITAVVRDLPRLLRLLGSTARAIAGARPDCIVLIDSPAFNLRLARRIRKLAPNIPIVQYVCPSVWAWLPGRAAKMKPCIDHVLCLLPFEPEELRRLSGPAGTFVGHRLSGHPGIGQARARQAARNLAPDRERNLLLLPGSRRSEVEMLAGPFARTVEILAARGGRFRVLLPTLPRLEPLVRQKFGALPVPVAIAASEEEKWRFFGEADAALAASGTVLLELALAGIPAISCYRFDPLMKLFLPMIRSWSGALPNLIADRPIVQELYDPWIRPEYLARALEGLWVDGAVRHAALDGYGVVRSALETPRPAGEAAAEIVLGLAGRNAAPLARPWDRL